MVTASFARVSCFIVKLDANRGLGGGLDSVYPSDVYRTSAKRSNHPSKENQRVSNNAGAPSEGCPQFLQQVFHTPVTRCSTNFLGKIINDLTQPLPSFVLVKDHMLKDEPSEHCGETEGTKGGENCCDGGGHGVLKLKSGHLGAEIYETALPDARSRQM